MVKKGERGPLRYAVGQLIGRFRLVGPVLREDGNVQFWAARCLAHPLQAMVMPALHLRTARCPECAATKNAGERAGRLVFVRKKPGDKGGYVRCDCGIEFLTANWQETKARVREAERTGGRLPSCYACYLREVKGAAREPRCLSCGETAPEKFAAHGHQKSWCMACERARLRNGACACGRALRKDMTQARPKRTGSLPFLPCPCGADNPAPVQEIEGA